jgi:hypothetical protein
MLRREKDVTQEKLAEFRLQSLVGAFFMLRLYY